MESLESLITELCSNRLANRRDAEGFFVFIEAPLHLREIATVCKNLQTILPLVASIVFLDDASDKELLRWQLTRWQEIAAHLAQRPEQPHAPSLHGDYLGEHALYVALWHRPEQKLQARFDLLMAQVCYSAHILRKLKIKDKDYVSARNVAMRKVRQLADSQNEAALSLFPHEVLSLADYYDSLDKEHDEFQKRIWKLLDYAVRRKRAVTHDGVTRTRGHHGQPPLISAEPISFVDEEDGYGGDLVEMVPLVQLPEDERQNIIADTLASPLEFPRDHEVVQFDTPTQAPSARQDAHTARKFSDRLALDNQMLSLRWRSLTGYEVACFLEAVDMLARTQTSDISSEAGALELAALMTCMFWTSSSVKAVSNFIVYRKMPIERCGPGYLLTQQGAEWVINPPRPVGYEKARRLSFQAERADDLLLLPVPYPARRIIERYLAGWEDTGKKGEMFHGDHAKYEKAVTNFLGRVKRPKRLRFTDSRISEYVFECLLHQKGGDIVTAMLATGRNHFLGWVPLHYTSISTRELQRRYSNACRDILSNADFEVGLYGAAEETQPATIPRENGRVGTRYCPRSKTVRTLVSNLKRLLLGARTSPATTEEMLALHNRMVVYTTVMVGFATGYRAVTDPFLRQANLDPVTGFAVIRDKDTPDGYHSRLIWVPPMVMEQLDLYHKHLDAFGRRLMVRNRKRYFEIRERLVEAAGRPMLIMLNRNLKSLTVSKGSLEEICVQHLDYEMPANANRHYLRTRLLKRGCPRDVIHAFMGHWEAGTEPWGRYSTLSPQEYRANIERFLLPVLRKDGWESIAGFERET